MPTRSLLAHVDVDWLDSADGDAMPDLPASELFVMGDNEWREEAEWPVARAQSRSLYLHPGGALRPEAPAVDEASSQFIFDPGDPVPRFSEQALADLRTARVLLAELHAAELGRGRAG